MRATIPDERQATVEPLDDVVDHVRGPADSPLILEYGDYECPRRLRSRPWSDRPGRGRLAG
jgi:hypothetical protein